MAVACWFLFGFFVVYVIGLATVIGMQVLDYRLNKKIGNGFYGRKRQAEEKKTTTRKPCLSGPACRRSAV